MNERKPPGIAAVMISEKGWILICFCCRFLIAERKALNYMRWELNKIKATSAVCSVTDSLEQRSFYLTNLRFRERWKELGVEDFVPDFYKKHTELKGYLPVLVEGGGSQYEPYVADPAGTRCIMPDIGREYVEKIAGLCRKRIYS